MRRRTRTNKGARISKPSPLRVVPKGTVYVHFVALPNGQNLQVLDDKLGQYAAVSYSDKTAFGDVFRTKEQAETYLKVMIRSPNLKSLLIRVQKIERLNPDGSRTEISNKGFLAALKKLFGGN